MNLGQKLGSSVFLLALFVGTGSPFSSVSCMANAKPSGEKNSPKPSDGDIPGGEGEGADSESDGGGDDGSSEDS